MAEPQETYPETATNKARKAAGGAGGEAALREAIETHGEAIAGAVETTDELEDLLTTAILVIASADEDELEHITDSAGNLIEAVDGLTTDGAAALAGDVGENATELSATLETVLRLEREGHLDDLVRIATAFSDSLSPSEIEELATNLEENGTEIVDALDVVLELQREGHLEELVDIAKALSVIEIEEDTARGLNTTLGAVGEAQRDSEPVGLLGMLGELRSRDARAGLGYLVALLKAQGRRIRDQGQGE